MSFFGTVLVKLLGASPNFGCWKAGILKVGCGCGCLNTGAAAGCGAGSSAFAAFLSLDTDGFLAVSSSRPVAITVILT